MANLPAPPPPSGRQVLADRSIAAVLLATFAAASAAILQAVALGKLVYDLTGRPVDLGFLGLAEFLPTAVLVLVTGSVADRFDRRLVGAIAMGGEVLTAVGLLVYVRSGNTALWPILSIVVLFGVARGFAAPAVRALAPSVAPPGSLPRVVAFSSMSWQAAAIVGPVLGGFLYAANPWLAFLAAAALFAVAVAAMPLVRLRVNPSAVARTERPSVRAAFEGLRVLRRTPVLFGAISLDLFAVLFGGAVALLPAIAKDRLGVDAVGLGWLRAAGGIGASLTGVALAIRPLQRHVGKVLLVGVGIFGVATMLLGVTHSFLVAVIALAVLSGADMVSVFVRGTIVPLATPDAVRGRVLAVEAVFIGASNELGAFESGVAAQLLGTSAAIVSGGAATLLIVAVWWLAFPAIRNIDRFSELEQDPSQGRK